MRFPRIPTTLRPWLPLLAGISIVALLVGVGIGRLLDVPGATSPPDDGEQSVAPDGHVHGGGGADDDTSTNDVGGTSLSQGGYTLRAGTTTLHASGESRDWSFEIVDSDGEAVSDYASVHGAQMHLFAVRADLTGYQHRHPELHEGEWTTGLTFDETGPWRIVADFAVDTDSGQLPLTLGIDVTVDGGQYEPRPLPEAATSAEAGDFTVDVDFAPQTGVATPALLRVEKDGEPVDPQPYLGARGHLVALRDGDMGFLHVHPDTELVDGALRFWVTVPSPGQYRAFLDFKVDGDVRTAPFTIEVS